VHTGVFWIRAKGSLHILTETRFTDVKRDNVLVNYGYGRARFTDVQLADCENTVDVDWKFCKDRDLIGAPYWRSPEAQLGLQWGPRTHIWSLGTMVCT